MWNLEPDLSWMAEPAWASARPSQAASDLLTPHAEAILAAARGDGPKQFDPITLAVLIAALTTLVSKVVEVCWDHFFRRANYNPFYRRRVVKALAAQLDSRGVPDARGVAAATLDHFRRLDGGARAELFAAVRAARA